VAGEHAVIVLAGVYPGVEAEGAGAAEGAVARGGVVFYPVGEGVVPGLAGRHGAVVGAGAGGGVGAYGVAAEEAAHQQLLVEQLAQEEGVVGGGGLDAAGQLRGAKAEHEVLPEQGVHVGRQLGVIVIAQTQRIAGQGLEVAAVIVEAAVVRGRVLVVAPFGKALLHGFSGPPGWQQAHATGGAQAGVAGAHGQGLDVVVSQLALPALHHVAAKYPFGGGGDGHDGVGLRGVVAFAGGDQGAVFVAYFPVKGLDGLTGGLLFRGGDGGLPALIGAGIGGLGKAGQQAERDAKQGGAVHGLSP